MKKSNTINLTRIPGNENLYENILKRPFTYPEEVRRTLNVRREYLKQKELAQEMHRKRSVQLISDTIDGVKKFVTRSLDLDKTNLFERRSDQIYGEILFLDMHLSDHELTLTMIEKAVKKLVNLNVFRMKANGKRCIPDLMDAIKQSKRVFLIVEQAECLSRILTETLVGHLKNRLTDEESPTDAVMILFCLSIKIKTLPIDTMHCFGRMRGIFQHTDETSLTRVQELIRGRGLKMKLAPEVLDFINIHSLNADSSTTNISFLHNYCLFEHYFRMNKNSVLTEKEYSKLESRHQDLCDDMQCLARFLYQANAFPEDITDIYEELGALPDLSKSARFYNALQDLKKIPHDRLVGRFQRLEDEFATTTNAQPLKQNALSILLPYKEKIANNKDCKDVLNNLIGEVMKYAEKISCPFDEQKNFYFDNRFALVRGCFSSSRVDDERLNAYLGDNNNSYFGVLLNRILRSPGQIGAAELCEEVLPDFIKIIKATSKPDEKSEKPEKSELSPPKRSRRRTTIRATRKCDEREGVATDDTEGLARAIFVDMIDSMAHQGIVKLDPRSKGKIIKRLAWPMKTNCD